MLGMHRLCERIPFIKNTPLYVACAQMACAAFFFSVMGVSLRFIDEDASEIQIIMLRNLCMLAIFAPGLWRKTLKPRIMQDKINYGLRGTLTFLGMFAYFAAVRELPLPTVIALSFTVPLITSALAALFLGESVGLRRWGGMAAGFAGSLIIIRPFSQDINIAVYLMIFTAFTWAASGVLVKAMSHKRAPEEISCGMVFVMTPICAVCSLFIEWQALSAVDYGNIILLAYCAVQGQTCVAAAFSKHDVSAVLPFDFLRLPFAVVLAFLFLGEMIDMYTFIGAVVIAGSALYVARREARAKRQKTVL